MTTKQIAECLCGERQDVASFGIVPPCFDMDLDEWLAISEAWKNVRELKRQLFALKEIWPDKAERFDREFDALVMEIAADLQEALVDLPIQHF